MGADLKIVLGVDASEVERAAQNLPGAVERAGRKGMRGAYAGKGFEGTRGEYRNLASAGKEIDKQEQRDQKKRLADYKRNLRFNSAAQAQAQSNAQSEQDRKQREQNAQYRRNLRFNSAAQAQAQAQAQSQQQQQQNQQARQQRQANAQYRRNLRFNSAAQAQAQAQQQQQQNQQQRQSNANYRRNLRFNSQVAQQQQQQSLAAYKRMLRFNSQVLAQQMQAQANTKSWVDEFGDGLEGIMLRVVGPAALAAKAVELGWGNVINMAKNLFALQSAKSVYGVDPSQVQFAQSLANVGFASNEEIIDMASRASGIAQANVAGTKGANYAAMQYFGMTDHQRYRDEGFPMTELLINMAKLYREQGGEAQYQDFAQQVLGENWVKLRPLFHASTRMTPTGRERPEKFFERMERNPTQFGRYLSSNMEYFRTLGDKPGDMMGGIRGGGNYLASSPLVTSLQSMGGGDIMSTISKGPIEQVASNTLSAAQSLQILVNQQGQLRPQTTLAP